MKTWLRTNLLFLLFALGLVSSPFSIADGRPNPSATRLYGPLVHDVFDFYIHTWNHVENTQTIADEVFKLIQKNPGKYRRVFGIPDGVHIDQQLRFMLRRYMSRHDEAKLNTNPEFLARHGLQSPQITALYREFGHTHKAPTPTVNKTNAIDEIVGEEFFHSEKVPDNDWKRHFFKSVEKLADNVERSSNDVTPEEMGRVAYSESGSLKFKYEKAKRDNASQNVIEELKTRAQMAFDLEVNYIHMATPYTKAKERVLKLVNLVHQSKIPYDFLDDFAVFEIIQAYERKYGKIPDPDAVNLKARFEHFIFKTPEGAKLFASRLDPEKRNLGLWAFERAKTNKPIHTQFSRCQHIYMKIIELNPIQHIH